MNALKVIVLTVVIDAQFNRVIVEMQKVISEKSQKSNKCIQPRILIKCPQLTCERIPKGQVADLWMEQSQQWLNSIF